MERVSNSNALVLPITFTKKITKTQLLFCHTLKTNCETFRLSQCLIPNKIITYKVLEYKLCISPYQLIPLKSFTKLGPYSTWIQYISLSYCIFGRSFILHHEQGRPLYSMVDALVEVCLQVLYGVYSNRWSLIPEMPKVIARNRCRLMLKLQNNRYEPLNWRLHTL